MLEFFVELTKIFTQRLNCLSEWFIHFVYQQQQNVVSVSILNSSKLSRIYYMPKSFKKGLLLL